MINKTLVDYMSAQLKSGSDKAAIKSALLAKGWQEQDIDDSYGSIFGGGGQAPSPTAAGAVVAQSTATFTQLPGAASIFSEAWQIYTANAKKYISIMSIGLGVIAIGFGIMLGASYLGTSIAGGVVLAVLGVIIYQLLLFVMQMWTIGTMIHTTKLRQENIGAIESFKQTKGKILSMAWISLLTSFIIMGAWFLLIIPALILTVWTSLSIYVLIAEDTKGMAAILKSKEYVRGYWGAILWRFLFISLMFFLVYLVTILVLGILSLFLPEALGSIILLLLAIAVLFVVMPIILIYQYLIYEKVVLVKGKMENMPKSKAKGWFWALFVLGFLVIPLLFSTIVLTSLNSARGKANDAMRKGNIAQMRTSMEMYYDDHMSYPTSLEQAFDDPSMMPADPTTKQPYTYQSLDGGKDYEICATLSTKEQYCASTSGTTSSNDYFFDDSQFDFDDFENFPLEEMNILEKARDALLPI